MNKNLITRLFLMILFICSSVPMIYSQWSLNYLTDFYGDKTDAKVISQKDFNGIRIQFIEKSQTKFISEIKVIPARKSSKTSVLFDFSILGYTTDKFATLSIKGSNKTYEFKLELPGNLGKVMNIRDQKDIDKFINLLKSENTLLKCVVIIDGYLYRFKINPTGFSKKLN